MRVREELLGTQKQLEGTDAYFKLRQCELEAGFVVKADGSGKLKLVVTEVGLEASSEQTHKVKLTFDLAHPEKSFGNLSRSARAGKITISGGGLSADLPARKTVEPMSPHYEHEIRNEKQEESPAGETTTE